MLRWKHDRLFMTAILFISTFLCLHMVIGMSDALYDYEEEEIPIETLQVILETPIPEPIIEEEVIVEEEIVEEEPVEIEQITHTVVPGDCLWSIADTYYDDGTKYKDIANYNNLSNSAYLVPGYVLIIPDANDLDIIKVDSVSVQNTNQEINTSYNEYDVGFREGYSEDTSNMTYLGDYFITGYDPFCAHCCGGSTAGITASGNIATINRTVAVEGLEFGTEIYVEGYGFCVVEDRGCGKGIVDIARINHEACGYVTRHNVPVYIIN